MTASAIPHTIKYSAAVAPGIGNSAAVSAVSAAVGVSSSTAAACGAKSTVTDDLPNSVVILDSRWSPLANQSVASGTHPSQQQQ